MSDILKILFDNQDLDYQKFESKLNPDLELEYFIGVRTPILRKLVKEIEITDSFLDDLPHKYFEENQIHVIYLNQIKDYQECCFRIKQVLPYLNSWASTDILTPKILNKHKEELLKEIKIWLKSNNTYELRYAVVCLMKYYLDDSFKKEYLELVKNINSNEYYVNMIRAWYFAEALVKHYDESIDIIEQQQLDKWTHNKAIQKAIESYRISNNQKEYLKSFRAK